MINKLATKYLFLSLSLAVLGVGGKMILDGYHLEQKAEVLGTSTSLEPSVLAATTKTDNFQFSINVPARFMAGSTFSGASQFLSDIVAPNIVYSLKAGKGIAVGGLSQTPTITNTGVLSLNSKTGELNLTAGDGIELDGLKIKNTGILSLSAGDNITIDGNKISSTYTAPDYTQSGWTKTGTVVGLTTLTDSVLVDALTSGNLTITNGESILPDTDLGSDLGSSSKRFNNLWVGTINSNSSQGFSGQTTFSYPPTDATITQASVLINPTTSFANGQLLGLGIAGYQRALIDEDGDMVLGYNSATSAPTTDYPLTIYGHDGTNVSYINTLGGAMFSSTVSVANGSATTPSINFSGDTNSGIYWSSSDEIGIATNGVYRLAINNSNVFTGTSVRLAIGNAGSTTTPALYFVGDTNTGIYNNSADKLGLVAGGTETVTVTNGAVGIGTTSPTSKLHLAGAVTGKALAIFDETGTDQDIFTASASGTPMFIIKRDGKIGVGTVSPSASLDVQLNNALTANFKNTTTTTAARIQIGNGSVTHIGTDSSTGGGIFGGTTAYSSVFGTQGARSIHFATSNSARMTIDSNGNVGIGTTTPTSVLHLTGAVTGKALAIFDETGNQNILTASASGVTKMNLQRDGALILGSTGQIRFNPDASTSNSFIRLGNGVMSWELYSGIDGYGGFGFYDRTNSKTPLLVNSSREFGFGDTITDGSTLAGANFVIKSTGRVGIGTTSPVSNAALTVNGNLGFSNDNQGLVFNNNLSKSITGQNSGNEIRSSTYDMHTWYTFTGSTYNEKLRLSQNGNLGLGTTSPTSKLHVSGAVTGKSLAIFDETGNQNILTASASGVTKFSITNAGNVLVGTDAVISSRTDLTNGLTIGSNVALASNGHLQLYAGSGASASFYTNNVLRLAIRDSSGFTGIGTDTTPDYFFDVQGDLNADSNAYLSSATGNVGIGGTTFGTNANHVLAISTSTAPTTGITDGIQLYAVDNTGSHELKVMDEAGNATTLSPHNFSLISDGPSEKMAWSYYSERDGLGINVDMTKALRIVEGLSGEKLIFMKDLNTGLEVDGEANKNSVAIADTNSKLDNFISLIKKSVTSIKGYFEEIFSKKSHQEELCVGTENSETCITKEQLDNLLLKVNITPAPTATPTATPTITPSPTPTIEITPTPISSESGEVATSSANI